MGRDLTATNFEASHLKDNMLVLLISPYQAFRIPEAGLERKGRVSLLGLGLICLPGLCFLSSVLPPLGLFGLDENLHNS